MGLLSNICLGFVLFAALWSLPSDCRKLSALRRLDALITDPHLYDQRMLPEDDDKPIQLLVGLRIRNIWNIDQKSMDLKMNLVLWLRWMDERLINVTEWPLPITDARVIDKIWKPEMFFSNSKEGKFHSVAVPNQIMRLHTNGTIVLARRYYVHFTCAMDFRKYPFDKQQCGFEISHIGGVNIELLWTNIYRPVSIHDEVKLPQFVVYKLEAANCLNGAATDPSTIKSSCVKAIIHFRRELGFSLANIFIPTIMIVMVSWTSFWIDLNAVPARVSLLVTTLLTISTKASSVQAMTAEVSYVKAVDVWMGVCTGCVFFSLVEYVAAHYLTRMNILIKEAKKLEQDAEEGKGQTANISKWRTLDLDQISRILFPLFFVLFVIIYWICYLI